jgi:hypothetical protein
MANNSPPTIGRLTAKQSKLLQIALAILAALWLPFVLVLNPGWLSLILFSPFALISLLPLLILLFNKRTWPPSAVYRRQRALFYTTWFLFGFFFTNFGDTEDSVQSFFSRLWVLFSPGTISIAMDISTVMIIFCSCCAVVSFVALALLSLRRPKPPADDPADDPSSTPTPKIP